VTESSHRAEREDGLRTLLVAEDSATVQAFYEASIGAADGYRLLIAWDGEQALEMAQSERPDAVLLDVRMPRMDGYEVCERLKADECTRDIPVLFASVLAESDRVRRAYQSGADGYLTKPFTRHELLAALEGLFVELEPPAEQAS